MSTFFTDNLRRTRVIPPKGMEREPYIDPPMKLVKVAGPIGQVFGPPPASILDDIADPELEDKDIQITSRGIEPVTVKFGPVAATATYQARSDGEILGTIHFVIEGGIARVAGSGLEPLHLRGRGVGLFMYKSAINDLFDQGIREVHSDIARSDKAERIWSLIREQNPYNVAYDKNEQLYRVLRRVN